jgi:hypothetical protein
MTEQQINAAITEAIDADPHWKCAKDYCTDLNAMHEAEKVLTGLNCHAFCDALLDIVADSPDHLWEVLTASSRQRAEAFLRTLGKWEGL